MSKGSLRIGKTGLNPTIPLCYYCGKQKNQIMLTGLAGERWARKNGISDGMMPMCVYFEGDLEPCDECKKIGISIAECVSDDDRSLTNFRCVMKEEAFKRMFANAPFLEEVLKKRVMLVPREALERMGFHEILQKN